MEAPTTRGPPGREPIDEVLSVLADGRRRAVVRYFLSSEDAVVTVDELVEFVHSREDAERRRERTKLTLHHSTLPKLAATGFLDYDARSRTVRYRGHSLLERALQTVTGVTDRSPPTSRG